MLSIASQKRREREKERQRQIVSIAARKLFLKKGFKSTTIADIAQEAELSTSAIYNNFNKKEDLYAPFCLQTIKYLLMRIEQIHYENGSRPEEKLNSLMEAMYDVYKFDPFSLLSLLNLQSNQSVKKFSGDVMEEMQELSQKALALIFTIFTEGINAGLFIDKNPMALADVFCSLFSGTVLWMTKKKLFSKQKDHLKTTLDIAFEIFKRGVWGK